MKNKEEILKDCLFEYYRPDFPSDLAAHQAVKHSLVIDENKKAILEAMERYAKQKLIIASIGSKRLQLIHFIKWVGDGYDFEAHADEIVDEYIAASDSEKGEEKGVRCDCYKPEHYYGCGKDCNQKWKQKVRA